MFQIQNNQSYKKLDRRLPGSEPETGDDSARTGPRGTKASTRRGDQVRIPLTHRRYWVAFNWMKQTWTIMKSKESSGNLRSTEVAIALLTRLFWVQFSEFLKFWPSDLFLMSLRFFDGTAWNSGQWLSNVDQTHLVLQIIQQKVHWVIRNNWKKNVYFTSLQSHNTSVVSSMQIYADLMESHKAFAAKVFIIFLVGEVIVKQKPK